MKKQMDEGRQHFVGAASEYKHDGKGQDYEQDVQSFYGFKYNYDSDTDDEKKYITK